LDKLIFFFLEISSFLIVGIARRIRFEKVGIESVSEKFGILKFFDDFRFVKAVFFGNDSFLH
jgi:hypothetical protein